MFTMLVAAAVGSIGAVAPGRAHAGPPTLVVRTYNAAGVASADLRAARAAARAILSDAGIDLRWQDCQSVDPSEPFSLCHQRVRADETVVRIVASGSQAGSADSLGYSLVDVERTGCLVTIFGDRIEMMAARAKVEAGTLLGRAIAHEIGHLLLGAAHSSTGLMRAHWYDDELRRNLKSDWLLSDREAMGMRLALSSRQRLLETR
jgi:hypothetical protein